MLARLDKYLLRYYQLLRNGEVFAVCGVHISTKYRMLEGQRERNATRR